MSYLAAAMRTTLVVLFLFATAVLSAQPSYTTGFEPPDFVPGNINGQGGWGYISNSPTGGDIVTAPVHTGVQSLALKVINDSPGFQFVANRLFSPVIDPPAGETGSVIEGVPVADPRSYFAATLWYRAPTTPVGTAGVRIAQLNPSTKKADTVPLPPNTNPNPANRYAQVRIVNDANGQVRVEIGWYSSWTSSAVNTFQVATVGYLNWGEWYRFEYLIHVVDGTNGDAPNDRFTLSVFDASGALVGTACGSTWEVPYRLGAFGGGTGPRAINGFDLWATTGVNGTVVGNIDDLEMHSFDAPDLTASIDGSANVCSGGTTLLSSVVTGEPVEFEWRDGNGAIVATTPTFTAGAGTYTLTVRNILCESATSAPLTITSYAPLQASISGRGLVFSAADRDPLTAAATGGSGTYTSFVWRDAQNNVVGSGPTYSAPAGTYTVTVTDANCGPVTSSPFTVAAYVAAPVPTVGEWGLLALVLGLAGIAMLRMR